MKLGEFINNHKKNTKVILASKVSVGNALIRTCNLREGLPCFNIIAKTPFDIAKEIMDSVCEERMQTVSPESSVYLMMNVLQKMNSELFPKSTLTLGTAREVLNRVNEIRENGVTEEYLQEIQKKGKIAELNRILVEYERKLTDDKLYDRCRIISQATEVCEEKDVTKLVPYLKGAAYGDLESNRWSTVERKFIKALSEGTTDTENNIETIELPSLSEEKAGAGLSFCKARGMTNEVRHVARRIKGIAQNESYGTVSLYHSSPEYINVIKAVFDAEKIPYCVTEGNPTKELHLTQFFIALLDSAEKDFSYELLENVVRNKVITFDNVLKKRAMEANNGSMNESDSDEGEGESIGEAELTENDREKIISEIAEEEEPAKRDTVKVNPIRGYRRALSAGIGWGKDRYVKYYERVVNDEKAEENAKVFARFLYDFVEVFDNELSIGEIYRRLWEFVQEYTYSQNPEKMVLNKALYEKRNELMLIDSDEYTLQEKIAFIRDVIENMKVEDGIEKAGAVCIYPLRDFFVMERKHNFLVGMSATAFSVDDKQSPLLLDEEKKKYVKGAGEINSPVEIASANFERLSADVKKSLRTRAGNADVMISYSYYDSVNLRDGSPSVFFIELSNEAGEIGEALGYTNEPYVLKNDIHLSVKDIEESVKARAEIIESMRAEKQKRKGNKQQDEKEQGEKSKGQETVKKEFSMSASGIQTLLSCPLSYYYLYIRSLWIDEHMTPKGHEWLNARNKGNICHYAMDKYMSEAKNPASGIETAVFDKAYAEALSQIEKQQPAFSEEVKKRETTFYKEKIRQYLEFLCASWEKDLAMGKEWKVIGCEIPFGKNDEEGKLKPVFRGEKCEILLNGSIDRADGYMNQDGKLMLRIVDYKTGKKEKKLKEILHGVQIQHYLYAMALRDYLESDAGKARCRELFGKEYTDYEFEWVGYTFPYEEKDEDRSINVLELLVDEASDGQENETKPKGMKERITVLPEKVTKQLDDIIGNMQADNEDVIPGIMDGLIHEKRKERKGEDDKNPGDEMLLSKFCGEAYCKYIPICRNWVGYTEMDTEEDEQ